jgi:hypothetical protein
MTKGAFKNIGLDNIVGWNIVWRRIRLIASIVTFLSMIEWMINFAMMHLQKLASHNGEMFIRHFPKHVGGPNSTHNTAATTFHDFCNQRSSVSHKVANYTKDALVKYETRLETSLSIVSLLALQAESFRGHDETSTSLNKEIF